MGALTGFLYGAILIGPSPIFGTLLGQPPNRSTSSDRHLQQRNKCAPYDVPFSVYIHESWTLGKPYGIKVRCYWERLGNNLGRPLGTHREHHRNQETKLKLPSPLPSQKEKNCTPHESMPNLSLVACNFCFQTVCHHFWPGLITELWIDAPNYDSYELGLGE
jgi:hypothetical protein